MPSSYVENIPPIMAFIERVRPASVLDVGTGYGKYAFPIRERLDDFNWNVRIDGVEAWPRYFKKSHTIDLYDRTYLQNFLAAELEIVHDLVLMVDVLEHFGDAHAEVALKKSMKHGRRILISTPLGYHQDAIEGNAAPAGIPIISQQSSGI